MFCSALSPSLSPFHLNRRSQTCHVLQRTCGYLLTDSKGKVTNCVMRVAALLLSPADAILCSSDCPGGRVTYCTVCRCINISIKPPSPRCRSRWRCHRHVVACAGVPAHQMAAVTNPAHHPALPSSTRALPSSAQRDVMTGYRWCWTARTRPIPTFHLLPEPEIVSLSSACDS